jgi:CPA2 family monovalent cation:H+ antiporter-2
MFGMITLLEQGAGSPGLVRDMLVVLGAAAIMSILLRRLRLASIPGYLIVGALIGSLPHSWNLIGSSESIGQIQDIAIILLMFTIGLHLDVRSLSSGAGPILGIGAASTIAVSLALWPVGMIFGLSAPGALAVAMAISMSSTAVVLGLLQHRKELHLLHGRLCVGIAIMQDLLSIAVLAMLPVLSKWSDVARGAVAAAPETAPPDDSVTPAWIGLVSQASLAILGIAGLLAFAKFLLPRLLREASRGGNTEGLLVASAGAGLGAAVLTHALGFGPALGAFLAGFMLSATPFRHQLAGQLSPMRDLFMAVFFTAVGAKLNLVAAAHYWWVIAIGVVLTMGFKSVIIGTTTWLGGATAAVGGLTGALLSQAGEFSLVILSESLDRKLVSAPVHGVLVPIVVISLVLTEPAAELGRSLSPRLAKIKPARWFASAALRETNPGQAPQPMAAPSTLHGTPTPSLSMGGKGAIVRPSTIMHPPAGDAKGATAGGETHDALADRRHVIIAGFGIVGRNLAEHFAARQIPYTVVELNPDTVIKQMRLGRATVFGDITNPDVLESAGIETAEAIVLTMPDDDATLRACRAVRELRSDIFIAARAGFLSRAMAVHDLGADHVTIEEVVTAQDMAIKVVQALDRRYAAQEKAIPHL